MTTTTMALEQCKLGDVFQYNGDWFKILQRKGREIRTLQLHREPQIYEATRSGTAIVDFLADTQILRKEMRSAHVTQ